jgi:aminoglycoside phosphotransferase (APT) family kinase protein
LAQPKADLVPAALRDRERFHCGLLRRWELDDRSVLAVSHGDAHIGNIYVTEAGRLGFLDWQTVCLAPWSDDVAYFLVGALTVTDRRQHERDLLAHYLKALGARGAPAADFETAWAEYRTRHLHGLIWLLVGEEMQPDEYSAVVAERYAIAALTTTQSGSWTSSAQQRGD